MTPSEKFRITMDLFQAGVDMMRQNLRRQYPGESDHEIQARLSKWLSHRPGAEHGDCTGRAVDWPRKVS
jgi:hypothetical protein